MADLPLRIRDHWLVVQSRSSTTVAEIARGRDLRLLAGASRPAEVHWTDRSGRLALLVWPEVAGRTPPGWFDSRGRAVAVRGQLRWSYQPWTDPRRWARVLHSGHAPRPFGHPLEGTVGDGSAAVVTADGRGALAADQVGLASVFHASTPDIDVYASRPSLAAEAIATGAKAPERDPSACAWFPYAGHLMGDATPYVGVERLAAGAITELHAARAPVTRSSIPPWRDPHGLADLDADSLLDVAEEVIADHLRALVTLDAGQTLLDLTGGKDSRLVLAVAFARCDMNDFRVRTVGEPHQPDVSVAGSITDMLGLEHETGYPYRPRTEPFEEQVTRFTELTDGLYSAWMTTLPHEQPPEVRASGTSGEMLRVDFYEGRCLEHEVRGDPVRAAAETLTDVYHRWSGSFLHPEIEAQLDQEIVTYMEKKVGQGIPADDLLAAHFIDHHGPKVAGLRLELEADHRVLPLADPTLARIVYARGTAARRAEWLHSHLVLRASPELASHPFAKGGWNRRPAGLSTPPRQSSEGAAAARDVTAAAVPARPRETGWSTLGHARARHNEQRLEFMRDSLTDPDNPVWDVADRAKVSDALDDFDQLSMRSRKKLYGLATSARWLSSTR